MKSPTAAQTPHSTPIYLHPECLAINWAHSTDGQKGMMVKTRTATYFPRFRVGASSEVTARAVSSLIPAPAPAIAIPARKFVSERPLVFSANENLTDEDVHGMGSRGNNHAKNDQACTEYSNVAAAHEIGEGAHEWTDCCESEQIGKDEPCPSVCAANFAVDQGRDAAEEVDGDLGACPEECHGYQGHNPLASHLIPTVSWSRVSGRGALTGGS